MYYIQYIIINETLHSLYSKILMLLKPCPLFWTNMLLFLLIMPITTSKKPCIDCLKIVFFWLFHDR